MIVKICGIRSLVAAQTAAKAGTDLIGFVFAPSRRRIDPETAAAIGTFIVGPAKVGIFVNQPLSEVREIADYCRLDYIQLHGEESPEYSRSLNRPVIRACRIDPAFDPKQWAAYPAEYLLFDSFVPGQAGGTGTVFDWRETCGRIRQSRQKFLVAGGLSPENVADAIQILNPDGVDVSGGVETAGVKDPEKIRMFIAAARTAAERMQSC